MEATRVGKRLRSCRSSFDRFRAEFFKPGELIGGLPDHAVFKVFWNAARTDSFAPPSYVLEQHHTKVR